MGAINESVYDWDIVRDRFSYSESMRRAIGLPPELLRTLGDWQERVHPEDFPHFRAATIAHLKGATERLDCDYRYRALDGTWRWARTHGAAIRDKKGRAVRLIGSTGDITELKRTEEALRRSQERYALATAAAVEGIYEWDIDTGSLYLTDRAKEFFAFSAQELTPAAWNVRVHAEDYPRYQAAIVEHFKGRTPHLEVEYRIADATGGYRWVLDRGKAVRNAAGRAIKMVGALSDVTQRKHAELELRRARDQAEEALAEQTATAATLKVTSGSPGQVQPVLQAILTNASRLCEASFAAVFLYDGEMLSNVAQLNASERFAQFLQQLRARPSRETTTRRCALECRTVHTADLLNDPEFSPPEHQRRENVRTALSVPMMRGDRLVGVLTLWRNEVRPFSDKQIALVQTFADQALIAIENVRLFNETKEALEYQTATSDVLREISRATDNTEPVLQAVLDRALRLCRADGGSIFRLEGDEYRLAVASFLHPEYVELERGARIRPGRSTLVGRVVLTGRTVQIEDALADPEYVEKDKIRIGGWRTMLGVPLMRDGVAIGVIAMAREHRVERFTEKQIELVSSFADQAVIAIENVRLFNETKEALERQTATAEILRVISGSITDTQPVFDAIVRNCQRLFGGRAVALVMPNGAMLRSVAFATEGNVKGVDGSLKPWPLDRDSAGGACILDSRVIAVPDIAEAVRTYPRMKQLALDLGYRSALFVPLMREGKAIACLAILRAQTGEFSDKEISLASTFADQAVIAIENARLFSEIQDKSRQLEVANRHKSEFLANMSHELRTPLNAIIGFTRIVMRRSKEHLEAKQYENLEKIHSSGQHLLQLINAILDLSKVEAGHVEVNAADVALAPVLEQCVKTVEPLVKEPAVRLLKEFDGELPQVYQDEEKLRQIVINLLSNAVKFTERGTVRVQAKGNGASFSVAVADTGIGIPADKLEHVFEEFAQADASSTRVHGGTGLGLTIARRLARLMGGDISVQSAPGAGSTFTLTLPIRYQPRP